MKQYNVLAVRVVSLVMLAFCICAFAKADVIKDNSFQVSSNSVNVTLRWMTDDESNVARFEIQRRAGVDGQFVTIGTVDPKGPSLYEFVDNNAFQKIATLYQYRIAVVFKDGSPNVYTSAISVTHTVSGVRRTWGSIKAMFR